MTADYVCMPHDETFDSKKLWEQHLNEEHDMLPEDWP